VRYNYYVDPLCEEFELDTDDEEEVHEVGEDAVNLDHDDGGVQADDEGDDEDAECPDNTSVDKIDPELQYEICENALGDCGVAGPSAVKRRCVNVCWQYLPYYIPYNIVATMS
jgi:homoserine acetyltransferase